MVDAASNSPDKELTLLRAVTQISGIGGWSYDVQADTLCWTDEAYRIHALDRSSFKPTLKNVLSLYSEDGRAALESAITKTIHQPEPWDLLLQLRLADASKKKWIRLRGRPQTVRGVCMKILGTVEETDSPRIEVNAKNTNDLDAQKLALIVQHTHAALMITNDQNKIQWVNQRFIEKTGYTFDEAKGCTPDTLLRAAHGLPTEADIALSHKPISGALHKDVELKLFRKDGTPYWAQVDVVPVPNKQGRPYQYIHIQNDVTARKESDDQKAVLLERFEMISAGAGIGYAEHDFESDIVYWDAQMFALHGLPQDIHAPPQKKIMSMVATQDQERYRRELAALRAASKRIDFEYQIRKHDGTSAWLHLRGWCERNTQGKPERSISMLMDVTNRKLEQVRSLELSQRLALATRATGMALWDFSLVGDEAHWNEEAFLLYGLEPSARVPSFARWQARHIHPDDQEAMAARIESASRSGQPYDYEHRIVRADGSIRFVHTRASIQVGTNGQAQRAVGVTIDITEHKEAQQQLHTTLERLRLASTGSGIGIFERALHKDAAFWNEECFHLFGLKPQAHAPNWETLIDLIHVDDRARFRQQWETLKQSDQFVDVEFRIRTPQETEQQERWLLMRSRLAPGSTNQPDRIVGVAIDITERKRAEMQAQALGEWMHLTTSTIGMGTWYRTLATGVLVWDAALKRIFGLLSDSPTPTLDEVVAMTQPQDRDAVRLKLLAIPENNETDELFFSIRRVDGQIRHLLIRSAAHLGPNGFPRRIHGVVIDITELKETQQTLRGARDRLTLATQASRFATWERDLMTGKGQWDKLLFRFYGLPISEHAPSMQSVQARIHPDDVRYFVESIEHAKHSPKPMEWEYRVIRPDGSIARLLTRAQVQYGKEGSPVRIVGATLDVTDTRKTSERLREALVRLRMATEAAGVGTFEWNLLNGEGRWDAAMMRLWGIAPNAGTPSLDATLAMTVPEDRILVKNAIEQAQSTGHPIEFEYRIIRGDGKPAVLNTKGRIEHDSKSGIRRMIGATVDVTASRDAQVKLREFHEWMQLSIQATGIGFCRYTSDGRTLFADQQFRIHFGLHPDGDTPLAEQIKKNIFPEDLPIMEDAEQKSLTSHTPVEAEYRVRDPHTGHVRHLFTRRVRVHDTPNQPPEVVCAVIDVTESRTAQQALATANERLALATRTAGVGIWEWDPISGREYWDARMREIYGITDSTWEPDLDKWRTMVHPDDRERVTQIFEVDFNQLTSGESEHRIVRPDGEIRTVLGSFVVERNREGAPIRMLGTDLDITEARRAQNERDALIRRLDLMASEVGIGVWEWDIQRNTHIWNDQMYALFGRTREQCLNYQWIDFVHEDDREQALANIDNALRSGSMLHSQFRVLWPDGNLRWIASRARIERDNAHNPVYMLGANWDVTDLFRADLERQQLSERISIAAAGAGIGFWHFVAGSKGPYVDDQTIALYGRTREADPDFALHWLEYVHEDDRQRMTEMAKQLTHTDTPISTEFRINLPDGRIRHLAVRARRSIAGDGRGAVINGANWDVTEQRMTESAVRAKETAERASAAKTEFLSRMSHELRTPLNAVLGFAQIMEIDRNHPLDETQQQRLTHIQEAGWHLLALINEVLDLSRIEAGKAQLDMNSVLVGEVIDECFSLMSTEAARQHVHMHYDRSESTLHQAWADRVRVKQVLLNLMSNAVKYNQDGGAVYVHTRASDDGKIIITVRDTGPGLTAEQTAEIFEPFNRLGLDTTSHEGTGIGLTISRKLAEQMGGSLDVSSTSGEGSEFRLTLQAVATPVNAINQNSKLLLPRLDIKGSILYVEDNPANVAIVEHALSLRPEVKLFIARNGAEAKIMAAVCQPDLLLLDLRLPDTSGVSLMSEIKTINHGRRFPCVAISANATPSDIEEVKQAGFVDFWPKPMNLDQLLTGIDQWLSPKEGAHDRNLQ